MRLVIDAVRRVPAPGFRLGPVLVAALACLGPWRAPAWAVEVRLSRAGLKPWTSAGSVPAGAFGSGLFGLESLRAGAPTLGTLAGPSPLAGAWQAPVLPAFLSAPVAAPAVPLAGAPLAVGLEAASPLPGDAARAGALSDLEAWRAESSRRNAADGRTLSILWDGVDRRTQAAALPEPAPAFAPSEDARLPGLSAAGAPDDPASGARAQTVEGSVFGWRPAEESPDHGWPFLDRLIRRVLGSRAGLPQAGFEWTNAAQRQDVRVFLYGERHSDKALIRENMRKLADDIRPDRGAIILDEGYLGPRLFGTQALDYLERRGLEADWLGAKAGIGMDIEVAGWDERSAYEATQHPLLQHHMNLLDINHRMFSDARGWRYYLGVAGKAAATLRNWAVMRWRSIALRNKVLDRSIRAALDEADQGGKTVHVIAGSEHLVRKPWWADAPLFGGARMRRALARTLKGRAYWAGKPGETGP
ncbi:MAG: hypothetical protein HY927_14580 [Elusimicrobia bacterium]|nr:hypothetical protein [Elusimicrobiota bacterium]